MKSLNSDQVSQLKSILNVDNFDFLILADKDQKQILFYPPGVEIKETDSMSDNKFDSLSIAKINTIANLAPQPVAIPPNCYYVTCTIGGLKTRILVCH